RAECGGLCVANAFPVDSGLYKRPKHLGGSGLNGECIGPVIRIQALLHFVEFAVRLKVLTEVQPGPNSPQSDHRDEGDDGQCDEDFWQREATLATALSQEGSILKAHFGYSCRVLAVTRRKLFLQTACVV